MIDLTKDWMKRKKFTLVTSQNIKSVIDGLISSPHDVCAIDLETTGLDSRVFNKSTKHQIVGFCLCSSKKESYYLPVAHKNSIHNVSWTSVYSEITRLLNSDKKFVFHNGKFDHEFLQYNGFGALGGSWDKSDKWEDTMILSFLDNPKLKGLSLKKRSKEELNLEMIEFKDLIDTLGSSANTFDELDPADPNVLAYACGDAICTFLLYQKKRPTALTMGDQGNQEFVYKLEKMTMTATRWMERNRILIDLDKIQELGKEAINMYFDTMEEIYDELNNILGRTVKDIGYLVLKRAMLKNNPEMKLYKKSDPRCFINMKKASKVEGDKIKRNVKKGLFFQMTYDAEIVKIALAEEGKTYNLSSSTQFGELLEELQVPDLKYKEKSKKVATGKNELDEVLEKHSKTFPFLKKLLRFREIDKAISTYLINIYDGAYEGYGCLECGLSYVKESECCPACSSKNVFRDSSIHVSFLSLGTETGRFKVKEDNSSGKNSKKDSYESTGNAKVFVHGIPASFDKKKIRPMRELRLAFVSRPGFIIVAADYAGVELRLATSMSREEKWEREYLRCAKCGFTHASTGEAIKYCYKCGSLDIGDLHTLTAVSIYGEESRNTEAWPQLRKNGKSGNFSNTYGGGPSALVRATGCSMAEAIRFCNLFKETYTGLTGWGNSKKEYARKYGFVKTLFNRKYPVPDINDEDGAKRSKSERNCVNSPIQGMSADVTKIAMSLCYLEFVKRGWINLENPALDKVRLIITMHDELVFEVKEELAQEFVHVLKPIMVDNAFIKSVAMSIPLAIDMDIGRCWDGDFSYYPCYFNVTDWPEEYGKYFPIDMETSKSYTRFNKESNLKVFNIKAELTVERAEKLATYLFNNIAESDGVKLKISYIDTELTCFDGYSFKDSVCDVLKKLE